MTLEELRLKALERGLDSRYIIDLVSGEFLHHYATQVGIPESYSQKFNPAKISRRILEGNTLEESIKLVELEMISAFSTPCYPVLLYNVVNVNPVTNFVYSEESYRNRNSDLKKEYSMRCEKYGNGNYIESLIESDRRGVPEYKTMFWASVENYPIGNVLDMCYNDNSYGNGYQSFFPCKELTSYVPKTFYRQGLNHHLLDE
jgi:hypothetical protein